MIETADKIWASQSNGGRGGHWSVFMRRTVLYVYMIHCVCTLLTVCKHAAFHSKAEAEAEAEEGCPANGRMRVDAMLCTCTCAMHGCKE